MKLQIAASIFEKIKDAHLWTPIEIHALADWLISREFDAGLVWEKLNVIFQIIYI